MRSKTTSASKRQAPVRIRMPDDLLEAVDRFAELQKSPDFTRSDAIRYLVREGLRTRGVYDPTKKGSRRGS